MIRRYKEEEEEHTKSYQSNNFSFSKISCSASRIVLMFMLILRNLYKRIRIKCKKNKKRN